MNTRRQWAGQRVDHWHRQRDVLTHRWPSLLRALPHKLRIVGRGAAIGLSDEAVVLHQDWLTQADTTELRHALLHLSAHAALGHRPWRWHPASVDAQLDAAVQVFLQALGLDEGDTHWQADHHGTWPDVPVNEPGEALMARGAQSDLTTDEPKPTQSPPTAHKEDAQSAPEPLPDDALPDFDAERAANARPQSQIGFPHKPGVKPTEPNTAAIASTDWREVLQIWLTQRAYQRWQFDRPSRRQAPPFILPRLTGRRLHVVFAVDVSGSIAPEWIHQFLSGIEQLRSQIPLQLRLITCDNRIHSDERILGITTLPQISAGGGTDFRPVFARIAGDATVDALVYCTDLAGQFPPHAPNFPVFWLVPLILWQHPIGQRSPLKQPPFGHVLPT